MLKSWITYGVNLCGGTPEKVYINLLLKLTLDRRGVLLIDPNVYVSLLICILKGFLSDERPLFYFMYVLTTLNIIP